MAPALPLSGMLEVSGSVELVETLVQQPIWWAIGVIPNVSVVQR